VTEADWKTIDFFSDTSLVEDPYPYFDQLRDAAPVLPLPHLGVVAVRGYDEICEVYRDAETFSSCNSVVGPYAQFPVPLEGDDVSELVDKYRDQLPMFEHMVTMDPPEHTRERAVLMRLITPKRLKENEDFIWSLADKQLDEFVADGKCEFIRAFTQPYAMLVVADLLGVPEEDHDAFRQGFGLSTSPGSVGSGDQYGGVEDLNLLGWADRAYGVPAERVDEIRLGGMIRAVALIEGRAAGTWAARRNGRRMTVELDEWAEIGVADRTGLDAEAADVVRFETGAPPGDGR